MKITLLLFLTGCLSALCFSACGAFLPWPGAALSEHVPPEFKASVVYQQSQVHAFGPAGINERFVVYTSPEALNSSESQGLEDLKNLTSTTRFEKIATDYAKVKADLQTRQNYQNRVKGHYMNWSVTPLSPLDTSDYPINRWWKQQRNPLTTKKMSTTI